MTSTDLFPFPHCPEPLEIEGLTSDGKLPDYPVWRNSLGRYMTMYGGRRWCIEDDYETLLADQYVYRVTFSSGLANWSLLPGWTEHLSIPVDPAHDSTVIMQLVANRFLEFVTASLL